MKYYLYNPLANNGIKKNLPEVELIDATTVDYPAFFSSLGSEDEVVLIGGDGTINYLINHVDTSALKCKVYIFGNGSGNDFLNDRNEKSGQEFLLDPYIRHLPSVRVNGREYRFINNMGLGIDGYVCFEAEKLRNNPNRRINYTNIALKGLLYDFKPYHVWLEVDGKAYEYDDVWLAPAMMGRFYGGGMMAAPGQDRTSGKLTSVIGTCRSRLKLLTIFPKIFEGKHVEHTDVIKIHTGNQIHVRFSRPCPAMIDGEVIPDVTEYWADLSV